jgi:hypothetical protein
MHPSVYALLALSLMVLGLHACQTLRPWEREHLAKPQMTFEEDKAENILEQHTWEYREGAIGGFGGGGGGCGCN